ncbi:thiamine pyrophosphokinase [Thelephora ganbajun]|uniref:Thiamine pyrophosphokinase n=1 Tax=Thelephora ganbajun TaxID=370292 RepID=A0ACB6ZKL5_THEGA|nr:thiamine pyrophosphokinase [Thelephora ganbajun]
MTSRKWTPSFLDENNVSISSKKSALIILNQPFSLGLLWRLWKVSSWKACADGGANRLYDLFSGELEDLRIRFIPDLIKGDFDSIRDDVKEYYLSKGAAVIQDGDQCSTDLMKCVSSLSDLESQTDGVQHDVVILGGLSGRLDQTVHTLSYLHKLRKLRESVFVITDDNVAWVLDSGEHEISIDHKTLGQTCGLLPVGVSSTILTTRGLRWNLTDHPSHFDGMVSTSNHLVPEEPIVYIKTTEPIWWTAELRPEAFAELPSISISS